MLQTKTIIPKETIAVAWDPSEIYVRRPGKTEFGKERCLCKLLENGEVLIYDEVAEDFGLKIKHVTAPQKAPTVVYCVMGYIDVNHNGNEEEVLMEVADNEALAEKIGNELVTSGAISRFEIQRPTVTTT